METPLIVFIVLPSGELNWKLEVITQKQASFVDPY